MGFFKRKTSIQLQAELDRERDLAAKRKAVDDEQARRRKIMEETRQLKSQRPGRRLAREAVGSVARGTAAVGKGIFGVAERATRPRPVQARQRVAPVRRRRTRLQPIRRRRLAPLRRTRPVPVRRRRRRLAPVRQRAAPQRRAPAPTPQSDVFDVTSLV